MGEWMTKRWCVQSMDWYLVRETNELLDIKKWETLQCLSLSESSPSSEGAGCTIPTLQHSGNGGVGEAVETSVVAGGTRRGRSHEQTQYTGFVGR